MKSDGVNRFDKDNSFNNISKGEKPVSKNLNKIVSSHKSKSLSNGAKSKDASFPLARGNQLGADKSKVLHNKKVLPVRMHQSADINSNNTTVNTYSSKSFSQSNKHVFGNSDLGSTRAERLYKESTGHDMFDCMDKKSPEHDYEQFEKVTLSGHAVVQSGPFGYADRAYSRVTFPFVGDDGKTRSFDVYAPSDKIEIRDDNTVSVDVYIKDSIDEPGYFDESGRHFPLHRGFDKYNGMNMMGVPSKEAEQMAVDNPDLVKHDYVPRSLNVAMDCLSHSEKNYELMIEGIDPSSVQTFSNCFCEWCEAETASGNRVMTDSPHLIDTDKFGDTRIMYFVPSIQLEKEYTREITDENTGESQAETQSYRLKMIEDLLDVKQPDDYEYPEI